MDFGDWAGEKLGGLYTKATKETKEERVSWEINQGLARNGEGGPEHIRTDRVFRFSDSRNVKF